MRFQKVSRTAVALVGSMLLAGLTAGCAAKQATIDPAQMSRIEAAAGKSEQAANKAETAANAAAEAAQRAEAAAQKAEAIFAKHVRK